MLLESLNIPLIEAFICSCMSIGYVRRPVSLVTHVVLHFRLLRVQKIDMEIFHYVSIFSMVDFNKTVHHLTFKDTFHYTILGSEWHVPQRLLFASEVIT